jgi:hypothetical protein
MKFLFFLDNCYWETSETMSLYRSLFCFHPVYLPGTACEVLGLLKKLSPRTVRLVRVGALPSFLVKHESVIAQLLRRLCGEFPELMAKY